MSLFRALGRPEESTVSQGSESTTNYKQYPLFVLETKSESSRVSANAFQALKILIY